MNFSKLALILGGALLSFNTFAAIPNNDHPTTFVGPTARLGYTNTFSQTTAYSLAVEAGRNNFRVGTTFGWKIAENQYFKISADYLWQDINYAFFSGNTDQWMRQFSAGAAYQYDLLDVMLTPAFNVSGYYAHAPSKNAGTRTGLFVNNLGVVTPFIDERRIAGAVAGGIAPGVSIGPWNGGRVGVEMNYDTVDYKQKNSTPNRDANGFGGTFRFKQTIIDNLNLNLSAGIRKPFNLYTANLSYSHIPYYGDWTLGLFGDYVTGKSTLPNTWNVGISADYLLDARCPDPQPRHLKGDYKGEMMVPVTDNLLAWTAAPAVYLPQVLAIADPKTTFPIGCPDGAAPTQVGTIGDQITISGTGTVNLAPFFNGRNLVFSLASISPALDPGNTVTVSPSGILNFDTSTDPAIYSITVRASNACGAVVSNTFAVGPSVD